MNYNFKICKLNEQNISLFDFFFVKVISAIFPFRTDGKYQFKNDKRYNTNLKYKGVEYLSTKINMVLVSILITEL